MRKIAIGTNDGITIAPSHFGMSQRYVIYTIKDGKVLEEQEIGNKYADPHTHKHAETDDIMSVLDGVDICIGAKMGRKSPPIILQYGRVPMLTEEKTVEDCLRCLLQAKATVFRIYDPQAGDWTRPTDEQIRRLLD